MTLVTKPELLKSICESPGWQPAQPVPSHIERALIELQQEGWIIPRLDGWEATPRALEHYPHFYEGDDGHLRAEKTIAPPERDESGRPVGVREPPQAEGWDTLFKLPLITVGDHQRIETAIDHEMIKGSVVLVNTASFRDRKEVQVSVLVRSIPPA